MNQNNIYNSNQRQFNAVMKREKITVMDYYEPLRQYEVFFRRSRRGNSPQGKLRFFYLQSTDINIGTIFTFKGENYLVTSQDGIESDIYYTSTAVKCDTAFSVWINDERRYIKVPCVVISDKYTLTHGSTISMISGSVIVMTKLNTYSKNMEIGNTYNNFGGFYKVGNTFQNNGILYIYMERQLASDDIYTLTYNGVSDLNLTDGTYQLAYAAAKNGNAVENPNLAYSVSDETVAAVDNNGCLTMLQAGSVTVTAAWPEGNTVCNTVITIAGSGDSAIDGRTEITGNTNLKNGYSRTYTASFYDASNNAVSGVTAVWDITDCAFLDQIEQTVLGGNQLKLRVANSDLIGRTFTLNAADSEGRYPSAAKLITIVAAFS